MTRTRFLPRTAATALACLAAFAAAAAEPPVTDAATLATLDIDAERRRAGRAWARGRASRSAPP